MEAEEDNEYDFTDPDAKMIVETYEPVLVSCHQDSFIRFWSLQVDYAFSVTTIVLSLRS